DLIAIVEDEVKGFQKIWNLVSLSAKIGTNIDPDVEVVLKSKGKEYKKSSSGDGLVDACYKAIEGITKIKGELLDYAIHSVTRGKDAIGEVTVKVKMKDKSVIAHGASTDIIEASVKAYINATNKVLSQESSPKR
ncbi:MAG: 2-isopropylmalate synthase, partial [Candidatus Omnitrophica bacterium]|nr:2-isopropylmalate synthase [Candidatus Omnitrophota bacterium]